MKRSLPGFLLLFVLAPLFARGTAEETVPLNAEFTLWVTAIDVSELPPSQRIQGVIFQRELVNRLSRIDKRERPAEELNRYEELAWNAARKEAAGKLAEKRLERDGLLFQGFPRWKYKRELKRIGAELEELEAAFAKADTEQPVIEERPILIVKNISADKEGEEFPPPPQRGGEEAFLLERSADALITGRMRNLYGRIYLELSLYTRGGAFSFEKAVIYSSEAMADAADELKEALASAVSGNAQVLLTITAEPEDAQILVNGKLVRSGEELAFNPGELLVTASAEGRQRLEMDLEHESGEKATYDIVLDPLSMEKLGLQIPGVEDATVYLGALYVGKLSDFFELEIPEDFFSYINIETEDGRSSKAIVMGEAGEEPRIITFNPKAPPANPEKKSVDVLRRKFYGAYGRFWIALPLAFLVNGFYQTYVTGYNVSPSQELYDKAKIAYGFSVGAWIGMGLCLAESLVRLVFYVRAADKEAVPLYE
jgi:hypothetical protein